MDILPVSATSEEQRETQHFLDVSQLNVERQRRKVTALEPNSQET